MWLLSYDPSQAGRKVVEGFRCDPKNMLTYILLLVCVYGKKMTVILKHDKAWALMSSLFAHFP